MRTFNFKMRSWAFFAIALFGSAVMTSCNDDDDDDPILGGGTETPVEDGFYITGTASGFSSPNASASFSTARNEIFNGDNNDPLVPDNVRPELQEAFVALQSSGEISITQVSGSETISWGFASDMEIIAGGTEADGPAVDFMRGSLEQNGTPITVDTDGLYHIAFDSEAGKMIVVPVMYGVIGGATPLGWTTPTPMTASDFTTTGAMTFTVTELEMTPDIWKFKNADGWKVTLTDQAVTGSPTGVIVNTNFGDDGNGGIVAGGADITNVTAGIYTVELTYTPGSGWSYVQTQTGELEIETVDYTDFEIGMIGEGLNASPGVPADWNTTIFLTLPSVAGSVYTWNYNNITFNTDSGWKIREGQSWDVVNIGYENVTITGSAASDFVNDGGNFKATIAGGAYNLTLTIDAETETRTLNVEPA